jgi:hypothetical protein
MSLSVADLVILDRIRIWTFGAGSKAKILKYYYPARLQWPPKTVARDKKTDFSVAFYTYLCWTQLWQLAENEWGDFVGAHCIWNFNS